MAITGSAQSDNLRGTGRDDLILGLDGDDLLDGRKGNDELRGGNGNDQLIGAEGNDWLLGEAGDDTLDGGIGNDRLQGGTGNDVLDGGSGDDRLEGGAGDDVLVGGAGIDTAIFSGNRSSYNVAISAAGVITITDLSGSEGTDTFDGIESFQFADQTVALADLLATADREIVGSAAADQLTGEGGDDTISGLGGDDTLAGGSGNDAIDGGADNDVLQGGTGADALSGGDGNDALDGGDGDDTLTGGAGDDVLIGGTGNDTAVFSGVRANYSVTIDADGVMWIGSTIDGTDTFEGIETFQFADQTVALADLLATANRIVIGTAGDDTLAGGDGWDIIQGLGGNDVIHSGDGYDEVSGGDGDDVMFDGGGDDVYDGGAGNDTLVLSGNRADYTVMPAGGYFPEGTVLIVAPGSEGSQFNNAASIETFVFADGAVSAENIFYISGASTEGDDVIVAGVGAAEIDARGGNDVVYGGENTIRITGGAGDDTLVGAASASYTTAVYTGAMTDYTVQQLSGNVVQITDRRGIEGTDTLQNIGLFEFDGASFGLDTLLQYGNVDFVGTEGDDEFYGTPGINTIRGLAGRDFLTGGAGDDRIEGGDDNDLLYGQEGEDVLIGGAGEDLLWGGAGTDTAVFSGNRADYTALVHADDHVVISDSVAGRDGNDDVQLVENFVFADGTYTAAELAQMPVTLTGTEGGEIIYGTLADDTINGLAGDDYLVGGDGNDTMWGGAGDDVLDGGAGNDMLSCGDGADTVVYSGARSDYSVFLYADGTVQITDLRGIDGTDTVDGIESFGFADQTVSLATLLATAGREIIGTAYGERIDGGSGDDVILGLGGNDRLAGNAGNDTLYGGDGYDNMSGGAGADSLYGGSGDDWITLDADDVIADGGAGYDRLFMTYNATVDGKLVGIESINTSAGDDIVDLSEYQTGFFINAFGNDVIYSSHGDDTIEVWDSVRFVLSGARSDYIVAPSASGAIMLVDQRAGGTGTDTLAFDSGSTFVFSDGVYTTEQLTGVAPDTPSAYADEITGTFEDDVIDGLGGDDQVSGDWGNDQLSGGAGNDLLDGGDGADILAGGAGDDVILGGQGGEGGDVAVFSGGRADYEVLPGQYGGSEVEIWDLRGIDGYDVVMDVEYFQFADGFYSLEQLFDPVAITGTEGNDDLIGTFGDDVINGLGGDDYLEGDYGNDVLDGGAGDDIVAGGYGDDILIDGQGNDTYHGMDGFDTLVLSGNRADYLVAVDPYSSYGEVWLGDLTSGSYDTERAYEIETFVFADVTVSLEEVRFLSGGVTDGDDNIVGERGDDIIESLGGNDIVDGDDGRDFILGGDGDDTLTGGAGYDYLLGGQGSDTFLFRAELPGTWSGDQGYDTVGDFEFGIDQIAIDGADPQSLELIDDGIGVFLVASFGGEMSGLWIENASAQQVQDSIVWL